LLLWGALGLAISTPVKPSAPSSRNSLFFAATTSVFIGKPFRINRAGSARC
jgi:hypothetical protein